MASFSLFNGSNLPRTLLDGESGFIGQLGTIAFSDDAIVASGSVDVTVLGALFSEDGNAIDHDGSGFELHVGQLGALATGQSDTVAVSFTESAFVSNDGALMSGSDALDIRATDEGGRITILNSGTISGFSDGIVTSSDAEPTRIVNRGSIIGGESGGIDHLSGDMRLVNRGDIAGPDYGYDGADEVESIVNAGSILGGVFTLAGDDRIRNTGFIDDVDLGDGDDDFEGRGGSVAGIVQGGLGDDVLRGGDDEDDLRGGLDNDVLRGRAGDDSLRGDVGADILNGGEGDDVLRGGGGADTFRFSFGDGFDRIEDLGSSDTIDLEALGLRSFGGAVKDAIRDVAGGTLIDLLDDHGLRIFIADVDADELTGGDFLV